MPISSEYDVWTPGAAGYISPTAEWDPTSFESIREAEAASMPSTGMMSYPIGDMASYQLSRADYIGSPAEAGFDVQVAALPGMGGGGALAGLAGLIGAGAGIAGILQALGIGEGGGIGGMNLLGGGPEPTSLAPSETSYPSGVEMGGPGLAEPSAASIIRQWNVDYGIPGQGNNFRLQYYDVGRPGKRPVRMMYNTRTKQWKWWVIKKPYLAVIGKNMPSHKQLTRLRKNLSRHLTDAKTIVRLMQPQALSKHKVKAHYRRG